MNQLPSPKDPGDGELLKLWMPWTQTLILLTRITSQGPFRQVRPKNNFPGFLELSRLYRSHTDDVKDIIRQYHLVCVALQETFLKSCHTTKIRRYGCVRKDTEGPSVSGGVCIFTSLDVPSSALPLHTSLQAVAVRVHSTSLITVCCLYLPPNIVIHQHDLNNLVDQLPAPFVILGDFNGHSTLWGSAKTNPRGRQIEQVLSDHCLCLLNHKEPTYFHEPTRSFHTLNLAICSPSLFPHLNLSVEKDLYNSDHFPIILSHDYDTGGKTFPPTYSYCRADWALFTQLAVITDAMIKTESVDTAVQEVTNVLIAAADLSIPKVSSHSFQRYKTWWNTDCQTAYKNQRKLWGIFRRYPTTENLLAFKKAKANARRVRRQIQRQSWIRYVSSLTSSTSSKHLWKKSVSSAASYNSRFLEIKRQAERTPINFSTRSSFPYNCDFTMTELKKALLQAHNTSPGPDGITYTMLRHLNPNSLANILFLFNRVWKEHCFPSSWREAIVTPILKPGKVATDPLSYRPIAITSCFCKTFERMVNIRLVYVLEKEKCISPLQRGFCKGRSTLDNLVFSESQIRDAFVRRNHLISLFFVIEKAYDRTWRYGILRNITSPVTSLYVVCHQPPLELRRRQLSANYFIRAMSVPSHPLKPFSLAIGLSRLYEARSFNIKPFSERAQAVLNDAHLNNINIQENNIFAFPPWDIQIFNFSNPFSGFDKTGTAAIIYQQLFSYHRNKFSKYIPVYTDGSKTVGNVGCGVVFNNTIFSFSLHNSMSVFSAELTAILIAIHHILVSNHRHFWVYTDSMSALESLHFLTERRHPTVIEILILLRKLERKGFDIIFPGYLDTWVYLNYIHSVWQETWDQQILNKLHSIHPSTSHWAALPVRRHDVRLTRLRIGHTRFTHRHILLGENAPECPSCKVSYSVYHILIYWPQKVKVQHVFRSSP
ncbi:probable RNA-directed DNA polymerase from transposon X-element [Trichonephila clavipes]|nr:probable RNA-directed DNA polymerase from transposon X-element [Trichonephila clavipes]